MGITITYGSYLSGKENIPKSCMIIGGLDTVIAVLAGIAIFPAVFAFGLEPDRDQHARRSHRARRYCSRTYLRTIRQAGTLKLLVKETAVRNTFSHLRIVSLS